MNNITFQRSVAGTFLKDAASTRGVGFSYSSFRLTAALWPVIGFGQFASESAYGNLSYQDSWPVVYTTLSQAGYVPAYTTWQPGLGGGQVVTIPSQAGTKNQVYDSAHCSGAFAFINSTTDTGDFPTPPFNQSTLIGTTVTPTQVVTSWTVYNYDGSVAGTATYTSALSQPVGYDSATLSCLSLLSQFALPTGDDAGLYVFPGLAGPIQDLIVSGGIFETYLPVVGPTAKGLPLRFDSVGEVARGSQTIRNWPWLAPGEGVVPNRGFVICMKSSWNLLPVPPAYSGIYPPTDSMGATYYEPTPANAGGHTVFQNPIANLFLVEWVQNPDGSLTIQSPVFLSSLSTPGVLNFDPSMVPETYGEIGFRNTFT